MTLQLPMGRAGTPFGDSWAEERLLSETLADTSTNTCAVVETPYNVRDLRLFSLAGFGGFGDFDRALRIPIGTLTLRAVLRLDGRVFRHPVVFAAFADKPDAFSNLFRHASDYIPKASILSKNILDRYIPLRYTRSCFGGQQHGRERATRT